MILVATKRLLELRVPAHAGTDLEQQDAPVLSELVGGTCQDSGTTSKMSSANSPEDQGEED